MDARGAPTQAQPPPPLCGGSVAAAIAESQRQLGCSRCRYAKSGCRRCRNPDYKARGSPATRERQQQAAPAADSAPAAESVDVPPVLRDTKGKRRRRAAPAPATSEPLLHTLRRHLQTGSTQAGGEGPAAAAAAGGSAAGVPSCPDPPPQQQQQKRAAEEEKAGRPAKYLKADPQLASTLQHKQQQQAGLAATTGKSKRDASADPSPSGRRPAKRQRAALPSPLGQSQPQQEQQPPVQQQQGPAPDLESDGSLVAAAVPTKQAGAEGDATLPDAAQAQAKRPLAQQHVHRPAKFRRVAPPSLVPLQQPRADAAAALSPTAAAAPEAAGSEGRGEDSGMDIDIASPRRHAAAAALGRSAAVGSSPPNRAFLAQLEQNMQLRRQERQATGGPSPLASAGKRSKTRSPLGSPAAAKAAAPPAAAAAAAQEPDPRLCLWEPPVSPYGLLEEELFDDPWKLLVACMLLNKTSSMAVRRVIWELFALCPTPAAAISADQQQLQALIQPLGLFRKRAAAIQQLSQDYLYKQWREPTELFGIGKYAADAYHMFCRGRWRDVAPDDKDLKRYRQWLEQSGGLGTGLTRHRTMGGASL
ncbi:hypothetical protein D9Q98_005591 [Chlorella vulgaris]|uniref:Methyl-CpG-binding domain protein 4 n=1 Tax=Chlorella vulgaris TaxID=3077 RepID=A0A9D4YW04_CHLVU|nr:hypothetical protein D9Q98_005591 [Chlorella vulgaris]